MVSEIADPLPMDRDQLNQVVNTVMVAVMTVLVGTIGVFVAMAGSHQIWVYLDDENIAAPIIGKTVKERGNRQ